MSKKAWHIINAINEVDAAIQRLPQSEQLEPKELTQQDRENQRQVRLLEEYDKQKRVPKPIQGFGPNVGSLMLSLLAPKK